MIKMNPENNELVNIFQLFFEDLPLGFEVKNTSRNDNDFREVIIAEWSSGDKYVIKLSDNDFTFPDKIKSWVRCAEEYRKLGYYCPAIFYSKNGDFPVVEYKGHRCVAYAEEYSIYNAVDARTDESRNISDREYMDSAFEMIARVAAKRFDFTDYPSGYCLFDRFCPSDATDEILELALEWKKHTDTLPEEFREQVNRIWRRWNDNRSSLEQIYHRLPTSVFQADLNPTNILIDSDGKFVGVMDFNLCGKDVFLNYLFREICWLSDNEEELNYILRTLEKINNAYRFSDIEIQAAPLLYRCLKPLWYSRVNKLKEAGSDPEKIRACLNETEYMQTRTIDFAYYMKRNTGK